MSLIVSMSGFTLDPKFKKAVLIFSSIGESFFEKSSIFDESADTLAIGDTVLPVEPIAPPVFGEVSRLFSSSKPATPFLTALFTSS